MEYFEYFTKKWSVFFYSFGIDGIKHFIVQDDKKTVGKVLKGIELANKKDDKITLIKLKFSMNWYYNLTANEIDKTLRNSSGLFSTNLLFREKWKNNKLCQCLDARRFLAKKNKKNKKKTL